MKHHKIHQEFLNKAMFQQPMNTTILFATHNCPEHANKHEQTARKIHTRKPHPSVNNIPGWPEKEGSRKSISQIPKSHQICKDNKKFPLF